MLRSQVSPTLVALHPIVLLSVMDHYNRSTKGNPSKRVLGVLLGAWNDKRKLDITNCYAVPFDEDSEESSVWFVDHTYHEEMCSMFRKVTKTFTLLFKLSYFQILAILLHFSTTHFDHFLCLWSISFIPTRECSPKLTFCGWLHVAACWLFVDCLSICFPFWRPLLSEK